MGLASSLLAKGLPVKNIMGSAMEKLYRQFVKKEITTFEEFHSEILDIFSTINLALPGKHFDVPSREEVEVLFTKWNDEADEKKRREMFIEFMKKIKQSKADDFTLITGLVTPPAAMAAKKAAGEKLAMVKLVPDVVFVPSATVIALISVKIFQKMFKKEQQPTS